MIGIDAILIIVTKSLVAAHVLAFVVAWECWNPTLESLVMMSIGSTRLAEECQVTTGSKPPLVYTKSTIIRN